MGNVLRWVVAWLVRSIQEAGNYVLYYRGFAPHSCNIDQFALWFLILILTQCTSTVTSLPQVDHTPKLCHGRDVEDVYHVSPVRLDEVGCLK